MARQREIEVFAAINCKNVAEEADCKSTAAFEGIIVGAKWADKTIIDKACEWLKFHVSIPYEGGTTENGDTPAKEYLDWAKKRLEAAEEICNDFRKAMEE